MVDTLERILYRNDIKAVGIHGDKSQTKRDTVLRQVRC